MQVGVFCAAAFVPYWSDTVASIEPALTNLSYESPIVIVPDRLQEGIRCIKYTEVSQACPNLRVSLQRVRRAREKNMQHVESIDYQTCDFPACLMTVDEEDEPIRPRRSINTHLLRSKYQILNTNAYIESEEQIKDFYHLVLLEFKVTASIPVIEGRLSSHASS